MAKAAFWTKSQSLVLFKTAVKTALREKAVLEEDFFNSSVYFKNGIAEFTWKNRARDHSNIK